ncbi:hypothetical protein D7D52_14015 [Nocardia yunnanensis]|uniref:Hemerythrin-like domain-containing protein n=1 Tax=Nocardia yunnanensis TaxID=2382165 RepID=A0A386ZBC7_9NOCA|nr:hemerythrin domain-containing protein [Nocardia yunnanensis]AYF74796.1 hypothetical protein D7D52_14015 [Nocardia yunnanensis]
MADTGNPGQFGNSGSDPEGIADALELLLRQHELIKALFAETLDATDPDERAAKFRTLRRLLAVHETAEEELIHPRARLEIADGVTVVAARLEEERQAKEQLAELESVAPIRDSPGAVVSVTGGAASTSSSTRSGESARG